MKYAIAQASGRQLVIKPGEWYDINLIKKSNLGDYIYLNRVLFFRNENKVQLGKPFLGKTRIPAKVIQNLKGKKLTVLKTKPKKRYTKRQGYRANLSRIVFNNI